MRSRRQRREDRRRARAGRRRDLRRAWGRREAVRARPLCLRYGGRVSRPRERRARRGQARPRSTRASWTSCALTRFRLRAAATIIAAEAIRLMRRGTPTVASKRARRELGRDAPHLGPKAGAFAVEAAAASGEADVLAGEASTKQVHELLDHASPHVRHETRLLVGSGGAARGGRTDRARPARARGRGRPGAGQAQARRCRRRASRSCSAAPQRAPSCGAFAGAAVGGLA